MHKSCPSYHPLPQSYFMFKFTVHHALSPNITWYKKSPVHHAPPIITSYAKVLSIFPPSPSRYLICTSPVHHTIPSPSHTSCSNFLSIMPYPQTLPDIKKVLSIMPPPHHYLICKSTIHLSPLTQSLPNMQKSCPSYHPSPSHTSCSNFLSIMPYPQPLPDIKKVLSIMPSSHHYLIFKSTIHFGPLTQSLSNMQKSCPSCHPLP